MKKLTGERLVAQFHVSNVFQLEVDESSIANTNAYLGCQCQLPHEVRFNTLHALCYGITDASPTEDTLDCFVAKSQK